MAWQVEFDPTVLKSLREIDRVWEERILSFLEEVASLDDPRVRGKALTAELSGLWRYRVGDYRIVCQIRNETLVIVVVKVAHRRHVYE